jgi:hypothetical protein
VLRFIISGYIPGTDRQVSFYELLIVLVVTSAAYLICLLMNEHRILQQLIATDIPNKTT